MERRAVVVRGIVQGVGFRPFVFNLASRLNLVGFVRNQAGSVCIEIEGEIPALDQFLSELAASPPPLALITDLSWEPRPPQADTLFRIHHSEADSSSPIFISPDVATCPDCLAELETPTDRRAGYPFLNCTNCGPRLTIITGAPYDRQRTTMASFPMCRACRTEYDNPRDRRFHAQPIACPACGPGLQLHAATGASIATPAPLADFAAALRAGRIGALKGLGGFHLACDAGNAAAVAELRRRKHRDEKPFAIMVRDAAAAADLCHLAPREADLLCSPRRPIVLLRKRPNCRIADPVAPENPFLGVMLPYTPLHHLLLHALAGIPLVMTSGNRSDEPIAYQEIDAFQRLAGIADLFLVHDRPIHVRCDDSVTRIVGDLELPLRRSRGYAPAPIPLSVPCREPILAVGGQLKNTFALGRGPHAILSHHLGDLDHFAAFQAFERDIALYEDLFAIHPRIIAHDLHPDYASTRYAQRRAQPQERQVTADEEGVKLLAVQHHHAHVASCMAEHQLTGRVIGVAFDGTGFGTDGAVWGGEFLLADYQQFERAAHLRYVGLPGGEQAIREPWRMAVAHLHDAVQIESHPLAAWISQSELDTVERMLERRFNTPPTSSAGRLFDAVAALAGVRLRSTYEGQAAIELEWLAMGVAAAGVYPFDLLQEQQTDSPRSTLVIDTRPLIRAVVQDSAGTDPSVIARRFYSTMVEMIACVCGRLRQETGLAAVVLSGGVFLNVLLTAEVSTRLLTDGFRVYRHRLVPPNDGGLSLGQLAVAAQQVAGVRNQNTSPKRQRGILP